MKLKLLSLLLILPILNGCMTYSESFDCPPGRGVGCKSLSQVNDMVEKEELPLEKLNTKKEENHKENLSSKLPEGWIEAQNATPSLRIWVAGYKDEEGNLHGPSYVYASLSSSAQRKDPIEPTLKEKDFMEIHTVEENS